MQNFIFFLRSLSIIFHLIISYWIIQLEKIKWENLPGPFSPCRPSAAASRPKSHVQGWPVTVRAPQSPPPGAYMSGSFSPIPSPDPADPHRRCSSGKTATRASDQCCLMPRHRIPLLPATDCGPRHPLTLLHAAAALTVMPWPSACRQGTRAVLPDGSHACASPRPPPSPPPRSM
jgi:hypothetical protein